jgi:putative transposase
VRAAVDLAFVVLLQAEGRDEMNLALMRQIDEQFLETPFFGVRQMTWHLKNEGPSGEREAHPPADAAHGADADLPEAQHQQAGEGAQDLALSAERAARGAAQPGLGCGHHLSADARGFLYLVAIMDWFTRKVLAWRISNTLEADFCVEALNEAVHKFGPRRS